LKLTLILKLTLWF